MVKQLVLSPVWLVDGKNRDARLERLATGEAIPLGSASIGKILKRGGTKQELRRALQAEDPQKSEMLLTQTSLWTSVQAGATDSPKPTQSKGTSRALVSTLRKLASSLSVPAVHCAQADLRKRPRTRNGLVLVAVGEDLLLVHETPGGPCRRCTLLRALAVVAEGGTRQHETLSKCRPTLKKDALRALIAELILAQQESPLNPGEAMWTCEGEGVRRGEVIPHPDCCDQNRGTWREQALEAQKALRRARPLPPGKNRVEALTKSPFAPIEIDEKNAKKGTYPLDTPFVWGSVALTRSRRDDTRCVSTYGGLYGSGHDRESSHLIALSEGVERLGTRAASGCRHGTAAMHGALGPSHFFGWADEDDDKGEREYCAAWELTHGTPRLIPLETVAVALPSALYPERVHDEPFYSGAASHFNFANAVLNGTMEILHRDAFFVSWYRRRRLRRVKCPTNLPKTQRELRAYLRSYGFELSLFRLTLDLPLPMLLLRITATRTIGNWPAGGTMVFPGAGFVPEEALGHCLRLASAQMVSVMVESAPFKDPLDPKKVKALAKHAAFWPLMARYLDPKRHASFDFLEGTPEMRWSELERHDAPSTHKRIALLRRWLKARGMLWLAVRLTDATSRRAGFEVAKVVIPGLVAMAKSRRTANLKQPRVHAAYPDASIRLNPDPHPLM